ncbi:cytochrome c biogenesis protein CcdA, partial [Cellulomonas massiliensis]|uniref:cytochrome c biogenesis protein CcdA n=1 Tax=Cellulomonas massiliensis TaxID=1465811 RepID=UPI00058DFE25
MTLAATSLATLPALLPTAGFGETVVSGSLLLAVPVAVLAGLVSFASPCVLPLVPGYLGLLGGMAGGTASGTAGGTAARAAAPPRRASAVVGVGVLPGVV